MSVAGDPTDALRALDHALDAPRGAGVPLGNWRWSVRQRLVIVRDRLLAERFGVELKRLVLDIAHHLQRVNDLVYDDVELELGGED